MCCYYAIRSKFKAEMKNENHEPREQKCRENPTPKHTHKIHQNTVHTEPDTIQMKQSNLYTRQFN